MSQFITLLYYFFWTNVFVIGIALYYIAHFHRYLADHIVTPFIKSLSDDGAKFLISLDWIGLRFGLDVNEIVFYDLVWRNPPGFTQTPFFIKIERIMVRATFLEFLRLALKYLLPALPIIGTSLQSKMQDPNRPTMHRFVDIDIDGLSVFVEQHDRVHFNIFPAVGLSMEYIAILFGLYPDEDLRAGAQRAGRPVPPEHWGVPFSKFRLGRLTVRCLRVFHFDHREHTKPVMVIKEEFYQLKESDFQWPADVSPTRSSSGSSGDGASDADARRNWTSAEYIPLASEDEREVAGWGYTATLYEQGLFIDEIGKQVADNLKSVILSKYNVKLFNVFGRDIIGLAAERFFSGPSTSQKAGEGIFGGFSLSSMFARGASR